MQGALHVTEFQAWRLWPPYGWAHAMTCPSNSLQEGDFSLHGSSGGVLL